MMASKTREGRPHSPWAPSIIFFVFLLVGPLVGVLTVFAASLVGNAIFGNGVGSIPGGWSFRMAAGAVLYILPFAYLFGGLQAALVGIVAVVFERRSVAGVVPLLPILIVSLISVPIIMFVLKTRHTLSDWTLAILVHIIPGLVCWVLCNAAIDPLRRKSTATGGAR